MTEGELETVLEELGDCLEDMARAVDRMRSVMKRMFRGVQELHKKHNDISDRVQRIEDEAAAARLEST